MITTPSSSPEDNNHRFLNLPGSKSLINRLLILNSLQKKDLVINPGSACNDVIEMLNGLKPSGLEYRFENNDFASPIHITYQNKETPSIGNIDILESGTALRFLISRYAFEPDSRISIKIGENLLRRPLNDLLETLVGLGAKVCLKDGILSIEGKRLQAGLLNITDNASSQFASSLLLSSSLLQGDLQLLFASRIRSHSYLDMTVQMLQQSGADLLIDENSIKIKCSNQNLHISGLTEPDYSSASYYWLYSVLSGKKIYLPECSQDSLQPDYKLLKIFRQMGITPDYCSHKNKNYITMLKPDKIKGINVSMKDMPDQVMTVALLALFASSETTISEIDHLRFKESDRINTMLSEFKKLGASLNYYGNELKISPLKYLKTDIELNTNNDHRFAMLFYVLKQIYPALKINNLDCINKSAPEFLLNFNSFT
jgi:3-phosphoshikimate 1-carboxyvinyltransferase